MWCPSTREPESSLHQTLSGLCADQKCDLHPVVVKWVSEGDVYAVRKRRATSQPEKYQITVNNAQVDLKSLFNETRSPILHRLALSPVGRPLWRYANDWQLIRGMRDALEGLMWLEKMNIVHRDISPGNIILAEHHENEKEGPFGCVIDLEYASFRNPPARKTSRTKKRRRDSPMSGTTPFIASELLAACLNGTELEHTAEHDAESFAYVLSYVILKRHTILAAKGDKDQRFPESPNKEVFKHFMESYLATFGGTNVQQLLASRDRGEGHFSWTHAAQLNPVTSLWMNTYGPGGPLLDLMTELYKTQQLVRFQAMDAYSNQHATSASGAASSHPARKPLTTFAKLKVLLDNTLQKTPKEQEKIQIADGVDEKELELILKQAQAQDMELEVGGSEDSEDYAREETEDEDED